MQWLVESLPDYRAFPIPLDHAYFVPTLAECNTTSLPLLANGSAAMGCALANTSSKFALPPYR